MSEKNNAGKNNTKFTLLAGMLAFGLLASGLLGSQMLNMAIAQTSNGEQGEERVVTSIDDIDCDKVKSVVHCVDDTIVAEPESGTSTSGLVPFYHGYGGASTVSTSGTASTKVKPDKFSVTVGVETNGTTAEEAASSNAELVAQVIAALKELGIEDDQISTSSYNIYPVHSRSEPVNACMVLPGNPIPPECYVSGEVISYRASNSVTVTLDVSGKIDAGRVIDTAIEAGANNVNGVYFFISVERQEEVRDSLIGDAIANARHRAEVAAEAVDMTISGIQSISLNDVYFPIFSRGFDGVESVSTPILPGEQEISMTVNLVLYLSNGSNATGEDDSSFGSTEPAMEFLLSKLSELGIQIDDELDIHMDQVVHISENEYHVEFSVQDINGEVHDGHIEVLDGQVAVAILDGQSIL